MLLEACLGLSIRAKQKLVVFDKPFLPESIPLLHLENLSVAEGRVSLTLRRTTEGTQVEVTSKHGDIEILLP